MRDRNRPQQSKYDKDVGIFGNVAAVTVTFFLFPLLFNSSVEGVKAFAGGNYSFLPASVVGFFWGAVVVLAVFGITRFLIRLLSDAGAFNFLLFWKR